MLVSDEQRSGSIAAISIVLGFSLSFTAAWSQGDEGWKYRAVMVLVIAIVGIAYLLRALFAVFSLPPLSIEAHRKATAAFMRGIHIVLAGYLLHIFLEAAIDLGFLKQLDR